MKALRQKPRRPQVAAAFYSEAPVSGNGPEDSPAVEAFTHNARAKGQSPRDGGIDGHAESGELFLRLVHIGIALSTERSKNKLMEKILEEALSFSHADTGILYILPADQQKPSLNYAMLINRSLGIRLGNAPGQQVGLPPIPLFDPARNQPNHKSLAVHVALTGATVNLRDSHEASHRFDFSDIRMFDVNNDYTSRSFLTLPLVNENREVVGVLQLINRKGSAGFGAFPAKLEPIMEAFASFAAIALNNQMLIQGHKDLLDAFVMCIARAVDAKSPHTSAHCQRVPELTELFARAACDQREGPFKEFQLNDSDWYELHVAAWMHDCGKLATPDHILNKATKLYALKDGVSEINARFELIRKDLEVQYLKDSQLNPERAEELERNFQMASRSLEEDCWFIQTVNLGGESMTATDQERVKKIANYRYRDFNGQSQPLLSQQEVEQLCVPKGTLTPEERRIMNNHIVVTIDMLESLPFPRHLRRVPEIAGGHHEKMDGTGFPKGLKREELSVLARMMGIADVFEALTSKERPYKKPMALSQAFAILKDLKNKHHIDKELYQLFLKSSIWKAYAQKHLEPEQIDVEDVAPFL